MASVSLIILGFLAVIAGVIYLSYKQKMSLLGSVLVVVIGLVGLYIAVTFSDIVLSYAGFDETGFPYPDDGYYLYQAFIYIILGLLMLGSHKYLLKGMQSKEISFGFWWASLVLLVTGGLDLLIDTFIRVPSAEVRFFIGLLVLVTLLFIGTKFRKQIFGRGEKG